MIARLRLLLPHDDAIVVPLRAWRSQSVKTRDAATREQSVVERLEILEKKVEALEALPAQVAGIELQILQFREELRGEFSSTRTLISAGDEETRRHMRVLYEDLVSRIATLQEARRPGKKKR